MAILLPTSILPLRQKLYEFFLVWHVALSVLVVAGCYLHIYNRFENQWGYELWIIITVVVWAFDRIVRFLRIARNGWCTAHITVVDEDYVRVDIKGVATGPGHAYLYFPLLTWRLWENHPFSVASTLLPAIEDEAGQTKTDNLDMESDGARVSENDSPKGSDVKEIGVPPLSQEGNSSKASRHVQGPPRLGLTFFIRTQAGLTSQLPLHTTLPVLVESMYGKHEGLDGYASLVCIAGGVGVTAVLPYLQVHPGAKKLFWGVRNEGIVKAMKISLQGIDKEVFVGTKMVLRDVLEGALFKAGPDGVAVVVSGPTAMADEVRVLVSEIGKRGGRNNIKLVEESFAW
ncbi:hypothetical protein G7Y89_g11504 [Cudoniella acicularis]|uniref:Ferric reductase n=1 Tax=Cudoniella acicularis TaxID=354080 RepID=A0A8H4VXY5_9HELO|nr:hypothetical protein G7Y89_g11504 [Cudoniella acicularis]